MIISRILVGLVVVSLPLVLTISIWVQFSFAFSLEVPFSASITRSPDSSQKPKENYIKSFYARQLELLQRTLG